VSGNDPGHDEEDGSETKSVEQLFLLLGDYAVRLIVIQNFVAQHKALRNVTEFLTLPTR
jgi:hypothetical protein